MRCLRFAPFFGFGFGMGMCVRGGEEFGLCTVFLAVFFLIGWILCID